MTNLRQPTPKDIKEWREQANKAAAVLKKDVRLNSKEEYRCGFVFYPFDIATVVLSRYQINTLPEATLADIIYNEVPAQTANATPKGTA